MDDKTSPCESKRRSASMSRSASKSRTASKSRSKQPLTNTEGVLNASSSDYNVVPISPVHDNRGGETSHDTEANTSLPILGSRKRKSKRRSPSESRPKQPLTSSEEILNTTDLTNESLDLEASTSASAFCAIPTSPVKDYPGFSPGAERRTEALSVEEERKENSSHDTGANTSSTSLGSRKRKSITRSVSKSRSKQPLTNAESTLNVSTSEPNVIPTSPVKDNADVSHGEQYPTESFSAEEEHKENLTEPSERNSGMISHDTETNTPSPSSRKRKSITRSATKSRTKLLLINAESILNDSTSVHNVTPTSPVLYNPDVSLGEQHPTEAHSAGVEREENLTEPSASNSGEISHDLEANTSSTSLGSRNRTSRRRSASKSRSKQRSTNVEGTLNASTSDYDVIPAVSVEENPGVSLGEEYLTEAHSAEEERKEKSTEPTVRNSGAIAYDTRSSRKRKSRGRSPSESRSKQAPTKAAETLNASASDNNVFPTSPMEGNPSVSPGEDRPIEAHAAEEERGERSGVISHDTEANTSSASVGSRKRGLKRRSASKPRSQQPDLKNVTHDHETNTSASDHNVNSTSPVAENPGVSIGRERPTEEKEEQVEPIAGPSREISQEATASRAPEPESDYTPSVSSSSVSSTSSSFDAMVLEPHEHNVDPRHWDAALEDVYEFEDELGEEMRELVQQGDALNRRHFWLIGQCRMLNLELRKWRKAFKKMHPSKRPCCIS